MQEKYFYRTIFQRKFGLYQIKHIQVGEGFQVDYRNIPAITDVLHGNNFEMDKQRAARLETDALLWEANKVPDHLIDYDLSQMKRLWPHLNMHLKESPENSILPRVPLDYGADLNGR